MPSLSDNNLGEVIPNFINKTVMRFVINIAVNIEIITPARSVVAKFLIVLLQKVGFKQLLIGAFAGAILMLVIYQLPVILSVRYGIDIWIWLRSVFGTSGVKIMTVIIILINYPWYAVCADLFASSMICSLLSGASISNRAIDSPERVAYL